MEKHLSMTKFGPRGLNLAKCTISKELEKSIAKNDIIQALRYGIGVDDYHLLQKSYPFSKVKDLLFNYI